MSTNKELNIILSDLKELFQEEQIAVKDFKSFLDNINSKEVINYLVGLSEGSKPESILREVFFTINSQLAQHLFKNIFPEVSQEKGFIDYLIKEDREEISLEIKPLFVAVLKTLKSGKRFFGIRKVKLNPSDHEEQILKYLRGKRDFVILTNLEEWYFFSKSALLDQECNPFGHVRLFDLLTEFNRVDDFWQYLDNKEDLAVKEPLDEKFFNSLKNWVSELSKVKFTVDPNKKTELIINLINKFIFIHSLDSFWVISKNYIAQEWVNIERKWAAKDKYRILRKYLEDINEYFYELYDTELFKITEERKTVLDYIENDQDNIELFYQKFKLILGIDYAKSPLTWIPGIIQYNFRRIDEDILGKSYETFLAEIRKEQGIYYTPKYITQYIVNNTVANFFASKIDLFTRSLEIDEYEECVNLLNDVFSFKVIDPACGSGSFLIKALKLIWSKYGLFNELIENAYKKYSNFKGTVLREKEVEQNFQEILKLKNLLNFEDKRKLISKIIIRHIHGVDLDSNALEVAKLNLWLEAIKLAPKEFQFDRVPADTNHILPDLEMNLCNGDSLVGLPDRVIMNHLIDNYNDELRSLSELRKKYKEDPAEIELVKQLVDIKSKIKQDLNDNFRQYLEDINVDLEILNASVPFYWPLDFWFVYFDDSLTIFPDDDIGFNSVIGNPPYFTIRGKGTGTLVQTYSYVYLQNADDWKEYFRSQSDIYYYFMIKSIQLLKKTGNFGFIIESYWIENDYADRLKRYMLENTSLDILINFGKVKKIFEDADNDTCILIFEKGQEDTSKVKYVYCNKNFSIGTQQQNNHKLISHIVENIGMNTFSDEYIDVFRIEQDTLGTTKWVLSNKREILEKIELNKDLLGDLCDIGQGVVPGRKKEFKISSELSPTTAGGRWISMEDEYLEVINVKNGTDYRIEFQFVKPLITNSGIQKYFIIPSNDYLIYTVPLQDGREDIDDYPGILNYLRAYEEELKDRYDYTEDEDSGEGIKYPWYGYQRIQNIEIFENVLVKILCPYRATENRFALDEKGYFGTTDMYAIVPKEDASIDINYLLGLLNSRLLTFWYKEAGKSKGLTLEFFATPLSRMPIFTDEKKEKEIISQIVSEILILNKLSYKFKQFWYEVSNKYRNGEISLEKLTIGDKLRVQNGEFEKVWISDINKFPDDEDNEELNKEFNQFKVLILNDLILRIHGIEDSKEILLLELETTKQEFRDIIYLEVLQLMESRRKVKSLKDILSKTVISIIKPNIWEKSFNLIRFCKAKFKTWRLKNNIDMVVEDPIQIDKKVESLENELNALVFKLYDLSQSEVEIILESLATIKKIKSKILKSFD